MEVSLWNRKMLLVTQRRWRDDEEDGRGIAMMWRSPLLNAKACALLSLTHCKSICPWLQRLSLIISFRAELGLMLLDRWWKVSFHIRTNETWKCWCPFWKIFLLGLKWLLLRYHPSSLISMIIVNDQTNAPPVAHRGCSLHKEKVMRSFKSKGFSHWRGGLWSGNFMEIC